MRMEYQVKGPRADHRDHRRDLRHWVCLAGPFAHLGGRRITVADTALLDDGTFAGSVLTLDAAFRNVVSSWGMSPLEAVVALLRQPCPTARPPRGPRQAGRPAPSRISSCSTAICVRCGRSSAAKEGVGTLRRVATAESGIAGRGVCSSIHQWRAWTGSRGPRATSERRPLFRSSWNGVCVLLVYDIGSTHPCWPSITSRPCTSSHRHRRRLCCAGRLFGDRGVRTGEAPTESREFTVSAVPTLELVTFDGTIEVRAWDQPERPRRHREARKFPPGCRIDCGACQPGRGFHLG